MSKPEPRRGLPPLKVVWLLPSHRDLPKPETRVCRLPHHWGEGGAAEHLAMTILGQSPFVRKADNPIETWAKDQNRVCPNNYTQRPRHAI